MRPRTLTLVAWLVLILCCSGAVATAAPRNIILCIGDGMGPEQVKAGRFYLGVPLSFEGFAYQAEMTTDNAAGGVTDSAAGGTAIATGVKVNNGVISMAIPGDGSELQTLLEYSRGLGKRTGLVSTRHMTNATPAVFGAHEPSRDNTSNIAGDYFAQTRPNILFGGGGYGITEAAALSAGYTVVTDLAAMQALNVDVVTHVSGQFGGGDMPYEYDGVGSLPHLSQMTAGALAVLEKEANGFFLMVEGARIDQACHSNDIVRTVHEVVEFHNAVGYAITWAQGRTDTLILVTADHETGGLTVTDNGAEAYPTASWTSTDHTATNVPVYAWGPNADMVGGVMDNTDIWYVCTAGEIASSPDPADGAENVALSITLQAVVRNPSGADDPVDADFYGRRNTDSFTIIAMGDTQNYAQSGTKAIYDAQTQWIVDNTAALNIVFVTHQGDVVNTWDNLDEWANANSSMSVLDGVLPYGLLPGNHDYPNTDGTPDALYFNQTFPYTRYAACPWYGGHFPAEGNQNSFQLFSAGGDDYVILHIEDWPDQGVAGPVIAWAANVLAAYPERKAIITTHGYLTTSGGYAGKWGSTQYIRTHLVEAYDSVQFVLCGHNTGEYTKTTTVGSRLVHELLSCYHADGWLRIMRFAPDEDKVYVQTYSPWLDSYQTDTNSQFELAFDMAGTAYSLVGSQNGVASGATASVGWAPLEPGCEYDWFVRVTDTVNTSLTADGPVWSFTTGSLKATRPSPADGAARVPIDVALSWTAGIGAVSHDVYFGTETDITLVSQGQADTTYAPGPLEYGITYFWVVDERDSGGSVVEGDLWSFSTTLPSLPGTEDFESGYTIGQRVGTHPDWYDGGNGPVVNSGIGVAGSVGLAPANNIFTWTAKPFVWSEVDQVTIGMDFQTDGSAHFDDDRVGWMITSTSADSTNIFGVQLDPGGSGYNIETYWNNAGGSQIRRTIANLPALSVNAWYRLRVGFTRLTETSAAIDVELWSLDSAGSPAILVAAGSIADTGALGSDAPGSKYFIATAVWPGYKNFSAISGAADNAYFEIVPLGPPNQPPVADDQAVATDEDIPLAITLTGSDPDPQDVLTFAIASPPAHGTLSGTAPDLVYTPGADYCGSDSLTYTAYDGVHTSNVATVAITVNPINDSPIANDDTAATDTGIPVDIDVLANDIDVDGPSLSIVPGSVTDPAGGFVVVNGGIITYTPESAFAGRDSFEYTVTDGLLSDTATVTIDVAAVDYDAYAAGEPAVTYGTVTGTIAGTTSAGDGLVQSIAEASNGPAAYSLQVEYTLHTQANPANVTEPVAVNLVHTWTGGAADPLLVELLVTGTWTDITTAIAGGQCLANAADIIDAQGNIRLRFRDTVNAKKEAKDTLTIDLLYAHITAGPPDTTGPAAPQSLTATGGQGLVGLDWADNTEPDLAEYIVYRSADGVDFTQIVTTPQSDYLDTGLAAPATYYYVVRARDAAGNLSDASNIASATATSDTTPPAAPTGLSAVAGDAQVTLDWNDSTEPDLDHYVVYRSIDGSTYEVLATTADSDYLDAGLTNGQTYWYYVVAADSAANASGPSNVVSATPQLQQTQNMQAASITMTLEPAGKNWKANAAVLITDTGAPANPLAGATVVGDWYLDGAVIASGASAVADGAGIALLTSVPVKAKSGQVFRFVITNVTLTGYTYIPNVTENSITVP